MAFLQGRMFQDTSLTVAWHMTTVLPVPAGHTIKQTGDDEDAELANAGLQTLGTTSADEDEDENEVLHTNRTTSSLSLIRFRLICSLAYVLLYFNC